MEEDPREDEEWFQRLPAEAKRETRLAWRHEVQLVGGRFQRRDAEVRMSTWQGGLLMAIPLLLANALLLPVGKNLVVALIGAVAGFVVCWVLARLDADRIWCALGGGLLFVAVEVGTGVMRGGLEMVSVALGAWIAANLLGVWGLRREYRQLDG